MIIRVLIREAWWKVLLLTLLYAWLSVVNHWFGTSFFIAIAYGIILGRIVPRALYQAQVPISRRYQLTAVVTTLIGLYFHFAFFCSFKYLETLLFPWQIWVALQAIAQQGAAASGYYTQWLIESAAAVISTAVTVQLIDH
ncbi:MAG: hypothetical protein H6756_00390 [Candidatus Omnitrophica bacterium]|nr:hypothetical protein [Candidatus Omnitrophota bacterium]MCB9719312.1 hypothetical protein [Candidatus Omnitrophota bacterium]